MRWGKVNPLEAVEDGRSGRVFSGLVFVLPATALSVMLAWKALRQLVYGADPPSYVGEPQMSAEGMLILFAITFLIAAFLGSVCVKLLSGVITGRAARRLLPWWVVWGVLGFFTAVGLVGGVITAINGDLRAAGKALVAGVFSGWLLLGYGRRLRDRQRQGDADARSSASRA